VIGALENIEAVAVFGEANALMGQVMCARVLTAAPEEKKALYRRVRLACKSALEGYKVPVKVEILDAPITSDRFKVRRRN
jgi:long-chain acyl-CoA synthetase